MAKTNGQGLFEKHVEKGVLAASGLILVITLCFWVVSSLRRIQVGGEEYSPSQVDEALDRQAQHLQDILDGVEPVQPSAPDDLNEIKRRIFEPYRPGLVFDFVQLQRGSQPLEPYRRSDTDRPTVELADLELLAPERPIGGIHREVMVVQEAPAEGQPERMVFKEIIAAHVVAVFPHGQLRKKWDEVLAKTSAPPSLTVVAVEAERRHRLPDGTWSKPESVSPVTLPGQPPLPPMPGFTGKNLLEVRQAIAQLAGLQEEILEPEFAPIVSRRTLQITDWRIHKPRTRVSDMLEEGVAPTGSQGSPRLPFQRGQQPGDVRAPYPDRRYPLPRAGRSVPWHPDTITPAAPGQRSPPRRPSGARSGRGSVRTGPRGGAVRYPPPGTRGYPRGGAVRYPRGGRPDRPPTGTVRYPRGGRPDRPPTGTVRYPVPGDPGYVPPDAYPPDRGRTRLVRPKETAPAEPEQLVLVPSLAEQLTNEKGILELWFHDTALADGMTYSYRVRLIVVNPLFGRFRDVKEEKDAETVTLTIPWSKWSEPVAVSRPTEFFLAGSFRDREEVYVDVFTLKGVQRLKRRFTVSRGEPIGAVVKMDVLGLDGVVRNKEVNFKTGAIAVDFDFDKRVEDPKVKIVRPTTEMLYLGSDGKLRRRTRQADQASQRLEKLRKEVQEGPVVAGARL